MPRPRKWRKVCVLPSCTSFAPKSVRREGTVNMSVDEYETIRLIDYERLTQEQCSEQMEIARTTVQAIYASARKKLSECIVDGIALTIAGGDFQVCERHGQGSGQGCCRKRYNLTCPKETGVEIDE